MSASDTPSSITSFVSPVGCHNVIFPLFQNKQHNTSWCCNNIWYGKDLHVRKPHLWNKDSMHLWMTQWTACFHDEPANFSFFPPLLWHHNTENMIWPNKPFLLTKIFLVFLRRNTLICRKVLFWLFKKKHKKFKPIDVIKRHTNRNQSDKS